jgi:hypothetical protein
MSVSAGLRIEDKAPFIYVAEEPELSILYTGCIAFRDFLARAGGTIPLWTLAAFYWSMVTIHFQVSVADLRKRLDLWYERFLSCIGQYHRSQTPPKPWRKDAMTPREEMHLLDYWAIRSDLRHGRILEYVDRHGEIPPDLELTALNYILDRNGMTALPSQLQPWGEPRLSKRYQELQQIVSEQEL